MEKGLLLIFLMTVICLTNIVVAQSCRDKSTRCAIYKRFCKTRNYINYLKENCAATCNFCRKTQVTPGNTGSCRNQPGYDGLCSSYKRRNYCKNRRLQESLKYYCKRTCGFCTSTGTVTKSCNDVAQWAVACPTWAGTGYCANSRSFMKLNCKKSCGLCSDPETPSCRKNKGGCKHKCTMVANKIKCSCNAGYELQKDKKTCAKLKIVRPCGRDKDVFTLGGRIVGGVNAVAHRWEWQGGMHYKNAFDEWEFVCGGALIEENLFLTAAHCVDKQTDERRMFIRFGDHNRQEKEAGEQDIKVKKIMIHTDWDRGIKRNDIALLQLEKNVKLSETIGTVCLPQRNINPKKDSTCYITGWGRMERHDWSADILQEANLPIVPNDECGKRNVDRQKKSRIWSKQICGGFTDPKSIVSGCMGDSGGPYVCKHGNKWVLEGVVSWGSSKCDAQHRHTVFTRVNKYIEWINAQKATLRK